MLRMSRYVPALDRLMSKLEKSACKFDLHQKIEVLSGVDRDKRKISITKAKAGADMTMKKLEKNITGFKITK